MWNDAEQVDLVWQYLRFGKEIRSRRTAEQLAAVRNDCITLIDEIESRAKDEPDSRRSSNACPIGPASGAFPACLRAGR